MDVPAIIVLHQRARSLADRIRDAVGGLIHVKGNHMQGHVRFYDTLEHLRHVYTRNTPLIALCASGLVIRAISPVLKQKGTDAPVLCVSVNGQSVVPLLGGHHGANEMASKIALALDTHPAITTAGESAFGIALDEPPQGYVLRNPEAVKAFMSALLDGASTTISGTAAWLQCSDLPQSLDGSHHIMVTPKVIQGLSNTLVYHPKNIAIGVGCERGCSARDMIDLIGQTLDEAGIALHAIAGLFSINVKMDEPGLLETAQHFGVPVRFFSAERLNEETPRLQNPSSIVKKQVGCPGVCEGAALAAAGPEAQLIVPKNKSPRATCAVAMAPEPINVSITGHALGSLVLVGIGPGCDEWRTPAVTQQLQVATDWVGYHLYLDLVKHCRTCQTQHRFELGEEEARVRLALELAAGGRHVALVCSGDAGIYAMASLAYELIDNDEMGLEKQLRKVRIAVEPGISAFQAAAARTGALIGHDFCCISLSDLLTPKDVILRRVEAAAQVDFVTALYNPRSKTRHELFDDTLAIYKQYREANTPVILATNLGRQEEKIRVMALDAVQATDVDMLTVVLIGSSKSTMMRHASGQDFAYTPRGYSDKKHQDFK